MSFSRKPYKPVASRVSKVYLLVRCEGSTGIAPKPLPRWQPVRLLAVKPGKTALKTVVANGKEYKVDDRGFLIDPAAWDEDFARAMAPEVGITDGLTPAHWRMIHFIRNTFDQINQCPLIYVACKNNDIGLGDLKKLFPAGWLRGACKLAGVTYREGYMQHLWLEGDIAHHTNTYNNRVYNVDEQGFLVDPNDWDENFAVQLAHEINIPGNLTDRHWQIIHYLRDRYRQEGVIPTVYDTCEANDLDLDRCRELFPGGYHRGAVRIAGLRAVERA